MCKNAYEKYVHTTRKQMIFCRLRENEYKEENDMLCLCIAQKFCMDLDKYIPVNQKENCKYYE